MKWCLFEAFGSIDPMTSIPYIENDHGADIKFKVLGAVLILSAYFWHFSHFLTCVQQSFSIVNQK